MSILYSILLFIAGAALGALIIYKIEKGSFNAMTAQCEKLALEEEKLRREREDCNRTRAMIDTIDDIPEYLREKYDIHSNDAPGELEEDYPAIYV